MTGQLDSIIQVSGGNATRHWVETDTGSSLSSNTSGRLPTKRGY